MGGTWSMFHSFKYLEFALDESGKDGVGCCRKLVG